MRRCFAPGNDKLRYVRVYRRSGRSGASGFWYYRRFYYYQIVHHFKGKKTNLKTHASNIMEVMIRIVIARYNCLDWKTAD